MLARAGKVRSYVLHSARSAVATRRGFTASRPVREAEVAVDEDSFFSELANDISSQDTKRELEGLQRQLRQIDQMGVIANQKPQTIDWAYYRSLVKTPGVVDEAEKACAEALKEASGMSMDMTAILQESDAKFDEILKSAEEMALQSALAQKTLMAELAACQAEMADIANLTIEDELKKNPEIAKQIEKEIDEDQWFVL